MGQELRGGFEGLWKLEVPGMAYRATRSDMLACGPHALWQLTNTNLCHV